MKTKTITIQLELEDARAVVKALYKSNDEWIRDIADYIYEKYYIAEYENL